jgi:selenide,water dikinase
VTGFGLLGHGLEMASASGVRLEIEYRKVPFLSGAARYATVGAIAGGLRDNKTYFEPRVQFSISIEKDERLLLFDPQTSGGLLLGVPPDQLDAFLRRAGELGQPVWVIGAAGLGSGIRVE